MTVVPRSAKFQFGSIRLTVFLLYTLILLITFSLFSAFIYFYTWHEIYSKVDALLDVRASGLEDSIWTYLKTSSVQAAATPAQPPKGWAWLFSKPEHSEHKEKEEDRFTVIAGFLTENKLSFDEDRIQIYMDIFDAEGNLIASSNTPPPIAVLSPDILKSVRQGEQKYYTYSVFVEAGQRRTKARAMMRPLFEKGQLIYLIQTRASLQSFQIELARISHSLVILVAVTLFVASWAGILLVKVTLGPVDHMVRKIRNIKPDDLSVRLNLPDANDEIRELAHTFNEMLEHVEKSFVAKKNVIQDLSHELKTPLTVMRGQLGVALKKTRTPAEYESTLNSNLEEVAKMRRIIDDLLMIARFDSRVVKLDVVQVNLSELVCSVLDDIKVLAEDKLIVTIFNGAPDVVIEANELHLRRAFSNLLDNAIKYTPRGGSIHVSLEPNKDGVWLNVRDSGIGIHADQLPHVFNRFYRVDNRRRGDGHGLGLSIVKSIVDAHKGEIRIDSEPGKGTVFRVFFHRSLPTTLF